MNDEQEQAAMASDGAAAEASADSENTAATEPTPSDAPEVQAGVEAAMDEAGVEDATTIEPGVVVPSDEEKFFYHGKEIVEKLEEVNGDGRLCRLSDGTTEYVPLDVLGE